MTPSNEGKSATTRPLQILPKCGNFSAKPIVFRAFSWKQFQAVMNDAKRRQNAKFDGVSVVKLEDYWPQLSTDN